MEHILVRMRRDFERIAEQRTAGGEWSEEQAHRVGLAIKAAIDAQELDMIARWSRWLAVGAEAQGALPPIPSRADPVHGCAACCHRAKPGRAWPGHCAERPDQPPAYGPGHPLRKLPEDFGVSCQVWRGA